MTSSWYSSEVRHWRLSGPSSSAFRTWQGLKWDRRVATSTATAPLVSWKLTFLRRPGPVVPASSHSPSPRCWSTCYRPKCLDCHQPWGGGRHPSWWLHWVYGSQCIAAKTDLSCGLAQPVRFKLRQQVPPCFSGLGQLLDAPPSGFSSVPVIWKGCLMRRLLSNSGTERSITSVHPMSMSPLLNT